jgi:hypothetical protein
MMIKISYAGYRFPPGIIQHAIWMYARFTLSYRSDLRRPTDSAISVQNEDALLVGAGASCSDAAVRDSVARPMTGDGSSTRTDAGYRSADSTRSEYTLAISGATYASEPLR